MLAIAGIILTTESLQQGTESYPTCCSGYLWITSPGTSRAISEASQELAFFWIDDVWVSGYIAEQLAGPMNRDEDLNQALYRRAR